MAKNVFLGGAASVAQVDSLTPGGTIEAGDKFIVTLTAEDGSTTQSISVSASGTTAALTVADIVAAFNASTLYLFSVITAANQTTYVKLTADTAGVPFHCTVSTTESDDSPADAQTFVRASVTANSGKFDWNTAANWLTGVVPVSTDDVTLDGQASNGILYGLNQSSVTLANLYVKDAMAFQVGTLIYPLRISATNYVINDGNGGTDGSTLINLHFGSNQFTGRVIKTRNSGTSGYARIQVAGTHASNKLVVESGKVGIGTATPGQATTLSELYTLGNRADVEVGSGVTLTTVYQSANGGKLLLRCGATTVHQDVGATLQTEGTGAITTLNAGGVSILNSTGTITTLNVEGAGVADFRQSSVARTVTNANVIGPEALVEGDNGLPLSVTFTNGIRFINAADTTQADLGSNVKMTPAAA